MARKFNHVFLPAGGEAEARPSRLRSHWRLASYAAAISALVLAASAVYGVAVPGAVPANVEIGAPAPDATFTTTDGVRRQLSQFRGRRVMLWLFATWCPTCQAGTAALASHRDELARAGFQVIQLELWNDLGYPGPSVHEFARAFAGSLPPSPGWLWGEASQTASYTYDPKGYPDIYFLIDTQGVIRAVSSVPNATMDRILSFATAGR